MSQERVRIGFGVVKKKRSTTKRQGGRSRRVNQIEQRRRMGEDKEEKES